jgi:hypothetical protein
MGNLPAPFLPPVSLTHPTFPQMYALPKSKITLSHLVLWAYVHLGANLSMAGAMNGFALLY